MACSSNSIGLLKALSRKVLLLPWCLQWHNLLQPPFLSCALTGIPCKEDTLPAERDRAAQQRSQVGLAAAMDCEQESNPTFEDDNDAPQVRDIKPQNHSLWC